MRVRISIKHWTLVILIGLSLSGFSQDKGVYSVIHFKPTVNSESLVLGKKYEIQNQEVTISTFKFYITDLAFYKDENLVHSSIENAYLIDVADSSSLTISENLPDGFNSITFNIGVDSVTNISGVLNGDLDPINGMYWTWQSGYINLKIEGTSPNCPARKNRFQLHIGGYRHPYNTQREVTLKVDSKDKIIISIQLEDLLVNTNISETYQIMSPGKSAVRIADDYATIFKVN